MDFLYETRKSFPIARAVDSGSRSNEYPFILITGRLLGHFNTGEMSRRSKKLMRATPASFVEAHPQDVERLALADGQRVRMTSPYGSVTTQLKISKSMFQGYLFAPNHFNTPNLNILMSAVQLDPQARMPELKVIQVSMQAA